MTQEDQSVCPVTFIIVTYNCGGEIRRCLDSLPKSDASRVLIVDNNSQEVVKLALRQLVAEGFVDTLIENECNDGFAKAVNLGISKVTTGDVVLLNPDATLDAGCLESLMAAANKDPQIGLLTPVVYSSPGVKTMSAGMQPTIWRMFSHYSGLSRIAPRSQILRGRYLFLAKHSSQDLDIEWAAGCCLYIPRRTLREVGLLSERWFMYGEDIEYCKRVIESGRKIRLVSSARAYHEMGVAVRAAGGPVSTMWPRNTYDYYVHQYQPGFVRRFFWKSVFSGGLGSRALVLAIKGRSDEDSKIRSVRLWAFGRAVWDVKRDA